MQKTPGIRGKTKDHREQKANYDNLYKLLAAFTVLSRAGVVYVLKCLSFARLINLNLVRLTT